MEAFDLYKSIQELISLEAEIKEIKKLDSSNDTYKLLVAYEGLCKKVEAELSVETLVKFYKFLGLQKRQDEQVSEIRLLSEKLAETADLLERIGSNGSAELPRDLYLKLEQMTKK